MNDKSALPLCACGCGQTVEYAGKKYWSNHFRHPVGPFIPTSEDPIYTYDPSRAESAEDIVDDWDEDEVDVWNIVNEPEPKPPYRTALFKALKLKQESPSTQAVIVDMPT